MIQSRKKIMALPAALLALGTTAFAVPTFAQTAATMTPGTTATTVHHHNFIQRHPTMTGIAAGIATHHALKVAAHNRKMHGGHLNWAERHPTLSAIGVGAVTRHEIKAHTAP